MGPEEGRRQYSDQLDGATPGDRRGPWAAEGRGKSSKGEAGPQEPGWEFPSCEDGCGQAGGHLLTAICAKARAAATRASMVCASPGEAQVPLAGWPLFPLGLGLRAPGCAQWAPPVLLTLNSVPSTSQPHMEAQLLTRAALQEEVGLPAVWRSNPSPESP